MVPSTNGKMSVRTFKRRALGVIKKVRSPEHLLSRRKEIIAAIKEIPEAYTKRRRKHGNA